MRESTKRAIYNYRKKTKRMSISFTEKEYPIYDYICKKDNTSKYIKELIKNDMEVKHE